MKTIAIRSLLALAVLGLSLPAWADRDHDRRGYRDSHRDHYREARYWDRDGYRRGSRTQVVLGVDLTPGYYWGNHYGRNHYVTNYGPGYSRYPVAYGSGVRYASDTRGTTRLYRDEDTSYEEARVISAEPILREVRREVPVRECWDETRAVGGYDPRNGTAGGAILGGLIGGAVGNQIGKGDGRRAATVAGAIIGAAVGHDVAEQKRAAEGRLPSVREEVVQRCDTRYETQIEERRDGYRVTYEYQGRTYQTRLPYDPGERLRIRVAVSPAER
ncbi:MAG: glycine zipper 2TM domain-containing protein [Gammaproteobacteria bacterium]